jgi:signal transduction histidine kinase
MSGGGSLRISTTVSDDGAWVEIRIQDTGDGILEQDRKRVFHSFFTTKIKGTGLGLTIVQRVLRNHGGEILLEQPETGGTRALVRLPVGNEREVLSSEFGVEGEHTASSQSAIGNPKSHQ